MHIAKENKMKRITAIILAMTMAFSMVACSSAAKNEVPSVDADTTKTADIVIVGAGAAGLSAAVEAVANGAESVIIIEKTATTGGSLNFTSGSMSGAETIIQEIDGVEDTKESYVQDILKNGANLGDEELIRAYVEEDVAAIQWLWDNGLSDNKFSVDRATGTMSVFAPEHALYSVKRTYKASPDDAAKYKSAAHEVLDTVVKGEEKIAIDFQTEAKMLVNNEAGQVLSVLAENAQGEKILYTANKGVIMATGGYSGNLKMMGSFTENGANYLVGGSDAADGYGIYMMQNIGANIDAEKMGYVPTFPMGLDTGMGPGKIASTYMWKYGAICVNQEGNRFVKETEADPAIREVALEEQTNAIQYDIFTDNIIETVNQQGTNVFWNYFYAPGMPYNSFVVEADSIEELAEKIGVNAENLAKTIADYNAHVESGETDEFGREFTEESLDYNYSCAINKVEGDKYYAIAQRALVVMTLGGVQTNTSAQVLDADGNVIPGLYAAGECVGGIWGKFVSGGTGVMGPIVFGRLAARTAMTTEMTESYAMKAPQTVITEDMFAVEEAETVTDSRFDMTKTLKDGEYTAEVEGQEGPMTVKTTVKDGKIAAVEVVSENETPSIAASALETVPGAIVAGNTCDVDAVAGATLTSNRIMDAVALCLEQAAA
ncbi:MAG: FAD-binding protein [Oscillospiraceae bacterium]|nr:FAD-binding protein [Oscillospiraceae bacterium]